MERVSNTRCPKCGAAIPPGAPDSGLCPRCLLGEALEPDTVPMPPHTQPGERIGPQGGGDRIMRVFEQGGTPQLLVSFKKAARSTGVQIFGHSARFYTKCCQDGLHS